MALVSIIIPVYNAEKLISRCLKSIIQQTFSDFEVILVDDGSKDNSLQVCEHYKSKDSRIIVLTQDNKGPSAARNTGIEYSFVKSNSEYLMFVDADDSLHPQCLEYFLKVMEETKDSVVMCKHDYIISSNYQGKMEIYEKCSFEEFTSEDLMIKMNSSFNYIWGKLYHKKCFESIRYPENISFGEDNLIIFKVLFEAERVAFIHNVLYLYFYTNTGITKSPWKIDSLDVFKGIEAQLSYYKEKGYNKAYDKEIELYIQQCAYQIHRIIENKRNLFANYKYLAQIRKKMLQLLKNYPEYCVKDNYYWFEALHPIQAFIRHYASCIKQLIPTLK